MKKNNIKNSNFINYLYIFSYTLFIVIKVLQNTLLLDLESPFFSLSRYFILAVLVLIFIIKLINGMNKNILYFKVLLILLGFLTYIFSRNADCFCVIVFIALASDIDYKKIIKTSIIVNIIMLLFVVICCKLGKLPDFVYPHESFLSIISGEGHSLGFKHYSNAAFMVLYISIMILFLKNNIKTIIIILLINILSLIVFTAKLPFIISVFYIVLLLYFRKKRKYKLSIKFWVSFPIICVVLSIIVCFLYTPEISLFNKMNTFFNNRLLMGNMALKNPGISLFGQKVVLQGTYALTYGKNVDWNIGYFFIDNDYLLLIISYGLFLTAMILRIYCKSIKKTIEDKNYKLFIWIISTLIFAFVNSSLISIEFNPIILVLMSLYYSDKLVHTKEGEV